MRGVELGSLWWTSVGLTTSATAPSADYRTASPIGCPTPSTRYRRPGSGRSAWGALSFVFPCQALECSAIHLTASCSVMKPLIASVSPSGHRISTSQPEPGFFRATKAGRCSNILRLCAYDGPVQASYPASIKLSSPPPRCWSSGCCRARAKPFRSCAGSLL